MTLRVLLLDDDGDLLQSLREGLEAHDLAVETARTVKSATLLVEQQAFDVVVTDLALDDTGGLAFVQRLVKSHPDLPIVVLSGHREARSAALRLGAKEMLVKPVRAADLVKTLHKVTGATSP